MSKTLNSILFTLLTAWTLTSCDQLFPVNADMDELALLKGAPKEKIKVTDVKFDSNYKDFIVTTMDVNDIGPYEFGDTSSVRTEIEERIGVVGHKGKSKPTLVKYENVEADIIKEEKIFIMALIDLTLPQVTLDKVKTYIQEIATVYHNDNLLIAFMDSTQVSETLVATPYVLNNHFKKSKSDYVYLYRSILTKRQEIMKQEGPWEQARKRVMLVFSNEQTYRDNSDEPLDPDHYTYESEMIQRDSVAHPNVSIYYASVNRTHNDQSNTKNVLWLFCNNNNGFYMSTYNWTEFKKHMLHTFNLNIPSSRFYFVNPNLKVYRGDKHKLIMNFYDAKKDTLITSVSTDIVLGTVEDPIIVNDDSSLHILAVGGILGLFIFLLVYIVLQYIVPYLRYLYFLRKYVITYEGPNMSTNNTLVAQSCYYCKAPFKPGDKIVTKCEHTVHKECWDENGHHCPEYSDRCKCGSHYYDSLHVYNPRNATFYLNWILMGILAAIFAWMMQLLLGELLDNWDFWVTQQLPSVGFFLGLFVTFFFSLIITRFYNLVHKLHWIILKSFVAAVGCFLSFYLTGFVIYILEITTLFFLFEWIPWTLSGFIIATMTTYGSRIHLRKAKFWFGILFGVVSMYSWQYIFINSEFSFRVLILFTYIIFAVGLAVSLAKIAPRSEHYYLKVSGAIKEMDIALYKWFRNRPGVVVTLGRSVNCSLQLSWDINSDIAPIQAELRIINEKPFLIAVEDGVFVEGEPLEVGRHERLYHGKSFVIGKTTFTYVEKDK